MGSALLSPPPTSALERSDGSVYFLRPPILERAQASNRHADVPGVIYSFTIVLPNNADEPLARLEFDQAGGAEPFQFDLSRVQVTSGGTDPAVLPVMLLDRLQITFEPPLPPGARLVVRLPVRRNPSASGTYFLGVTAFPPGQQAVGQFIGFGRFRIQRRGGGDE